MARLTSLILVAACAWNATKGSVGIWSDMLRISNISSGQIGWFTKFCTLQIFPVLPRLVHGPEIDQSLVHWRSYDPFEIRCSKTCFRLLCCSSTLQMEDLNTTIFTLTLRGTLDHTGPRVLPRVIGVCARYTGETSRVDEELLTCITSNNYLTPPPCHPGALLGSRFTAWHGMFKTLANGLYGCRNMSNLKKSQDPVLRKKREYKGGLQMSKS